jgi:hypothetical protein
VLDFQRQSVTLYRLCPVGSQVNEIYERDSLWELEKQLFDDEREGIFAAAAALPKLRHLHWSLQVSMNLVLVNKVDVVLFVSYLRAPALVAAGEVPFTYGLVIVLNGERYVLRERFGRMLRAY